MDARWAEPEEIAEQMDVVTAACSYCGGPARVPEDVMAVQVDSTGRQRPLVCCERCTPEVGARLRLEMEREMRRRGR